MKLSTLVFLVRDGCVYLANKKRKFGAGCLNGYGGKMQPEDKTIEDTAIRELREESGVTALNLLKVGVIEFFEEETLIFNCHIFFCSKWEGNLRETEEMGMPEPYLLDNLPYDRMWHGDRTWLPIIFSGQNIRGKSYYNKGMTKQIRFEQVPF